MYYIFVYILILQEITVNILIKEVLLLHNTENFT